MRQETKIAAVGGAGTSAAGFHIAAEHSITLPAQNAKSIPWVARKEKTRGSQTTEANIQKNQERDKQAGAHDQRLLFGGCDELNGSNPIPAYCQK